MGNAGSGSSGSRSAGKVDDVMPSSPCRDEPAFLFDKKPRSSLVYQTSQDDEEPLYTKPKQIPEGEVGVGGRHRSATVSEGAPIEGDSPKVLPTVFKWDGGGKQVLISGTFNNWKSIPMVKSHGDFVTIIDLPEGEHQYKFLVDGEWKHDPSGKIVDDDGANKNNLISVKNSDFEVFRALDSDSQPIDYGENDGYSQDVPIGKPWEKPSGPPILPPHLLQVILNQDTPISCEPTLLPEPNHVMLNHLYALSIKDGVMVLSATHRYRKKYVTTLLYKPI